MDTHLDTEWRILLSLCFPSNDDRGSISKELFQLPVDWGYLLLSALSHRMIPALSFRLDDFDLWGIVPIYVRKHLQNQLYFNRRRNEEIRFFAEALAQNLHDAHVPYSFTKGVVLAPLLYEDSGERQLGDIDVVVPYNSRETVTEIMHTLAFVQGETYYDRGEPRVKPFSRPELIQYALSPDHLPHFARAGSETYGPGTMVDFSHTLSWHGSGIDLPIDGILDQAVWKPLSPQGAKVRVLWTEWLFAWVVFHAFREAWFIASKKFHKDVSLLQFRDIVRLWLLSKEEIIRSGIVEKLRTANGLFPFAWFIAHVDEVFGMSILDELELRRDFDDRLLKFGSMSNSGPLIPWSGTMNDRLRHTDRAQLFDFNRPRQSDI
jgi:hypothetical protein